MTARIDSYIDAIGYASPGVKLCAGGPSSKRIPIPPDVLTGFRSLGELWTSDADDEALAVAE